MGAHGLLVNKKHVHYIYHSVLGKQPCGPKLLVMFKYPQALTRDARVVFIGETTVHTADLHNVVPSIILP